jgi:hypothetical protein
MKLKNTIAIRIALITYAFCWLCGLPQVLRETANQDTAVAVAGWGFYLFFLGATVWGIVQLSSLRRQAKEFAERLSQRVDSVGSYEEFTAPSR